MAICLNLGNKTICIGDGWTLMTEAEKAGAQAEGRKGREADIAKRLRELPGRDEMERIQREVLALLIENDFTGSVAGTAIRSDNRMYGYFFAKAAYLRGCDGGVTGGLLVSRLDGDPHVWHMYLRRLPRWEHALTEEEKDRCLQSIEIELRRLEKLHENA